MDDSRGFDDGWDSDDEFEHVQHYVGMGNAMSALARFEALYTSKAMSDACLIVGGREIACHRVILGASSDVFQAMLMGAFSESRSFRVHLVEPPECQPIFEHFLRYFYTGHVEMTLDTMLPFLILADKYNVKELISHCLDAMTTHVAVAAVHGELARWLDYLALYGHDRIERTCRDFLSHNPMLIFRRRRELRSLNIDLLSSMLRQSDLVVENEVVLFEAVLKWLKIHKVEDEDEMASMVSRLMALIRFPMMTPGDIAKLPLFPLVRKHTNLFMTLMASAMEFHSGRLNPKMLEDAETRCQFEPRLYTEDKFSTLITMENFRRLLVYYTNTLVFSSSTALSHCQGPKVCEWVVDVFPKGVWINKCFLIEYQGNKVVPEHVTDTVRLAITCKYMHTSHNGTLRAKIAVLIYGVLSGIECVHTLKQIVHQFTEDETVLILNDLVPFNQLNINVGHSDYLTGPQRDDFKIRVIIEPLLK